MFIIKRKTDGKFLRRTPSWLHETADGDWTDAISKARVFGRREDAKQSRGWKKGEYAKPYPGYYPKAGESSEAWMQRKIEYSKSFVAYTDETRPVEIVKVFLITENALL